MNYTGVCSNYKFKVNYVYLFHIEHIILCIKRIEQAFKYDYVWILEQDVGFSGNINKLFKKYEYSHFDFLSAYKENKNGWYYCCTSIYMRYRKNILKGKGYKTKEHIQRWSKNYITNVYNLLLKNLHSQSEVGSIEYAMLLNLSIKSFDFNDIGYKYSFNTQVSKNEWSLIMNSSKYQNKQFHALKW